MDYIEGSNRDQMILFPESLDEYIAGENPVRVIGAFVDNLDLQALGFTHTVTNETGRPPYHPAVLLKLYIYGYLNRVRSSRTLEREAGRNVEVMWLTGKLAPDFKTIANFRRHNRKAIQEVCRAFTAFCRDLDLFSRDLVAIDGSLSPKGVSSRRSTPESATSPIASSNRPSKTSTRRLKPTWTSWTPTTPRNPKNASSALRS